MSSYSGLNVLPLVAVLQRRGDAIRRAEIEKARRRLGPLTPDQVEALDDATGAIVQKLLETPTARLAEAQADPGLFRRLFGLE